MQRRHIIIDMEADLPEDINGIYTRVEGKFIILVNKSLLPTEKEFVLNEGYQLYDNLTITKHINPVELAQKLRIKALHDMMDNPCIKEVFTMKKTQYADEFSEYLMVKKEMAKEIILNKDLLYSIS